ncbi:hypothetical protein fugu_003411 [Takifugu bimaculatus]|uniref:Uncharacterized protein n=1 Tax=Takifugu bimaculatus TaxID=433685 RepID=A0A4Z2BGS2_9TELE|nr:hypothetical protein fugu_003411 [Takifugu bimaculatus]
MSRKRETTLSEAVKWSTDEEMIPIGTATRRSSRSPTSECIKAATTVDSSGFPVSIPGRGVAFQQPRRSSPTRMTDGTGLTASQMRRNGALLPTETILASSATQRILNRSGEPSRLIRPGLNSTTQTAETGRRDGPSPYTNATWEPDPRCRACRTVARLGTESPAGRTRGMNASKGEIRGPMRMRTERSGRDGPGPSVRGGPSSSRGRSSFSERDGKSMTINNQPFTSGRQVVVERHSRESGLRKEWQGGSNSQERAFPDNRRMESRGSLMGSSSHSSSGLNRIVQITSNSIPSGGSTGGFKSYKGTPRQF